MRLEITVGSSEPSIYPLSKPKITIGSSDACEIALTTNGLSRKHITILVENDTFYVIDQGSTNGSYMNEERLIPGKKIEFTSFFPIRLGDDVVMSLLSDDEVRNGILIPLREQASDRSRTDISRPDITSTGISRNQLKRDSTGSFSNFKNQNNNKQKSQSGKDSSGSGGIKKKFDVIPLAAFMIVAAAVYWNLFVWKQEPDPDAAVAVEEYKIPKTKPIEKVHSDLVAKEDLVTKEDLTRYQGDIKCVSDVEVYFCNLFPGIKSSHFGVVQSKLSVNIMIDGTPYFEEAKKTIDPYTSLNPSMTQGQTHERQESFSAVHYNMGVFLFLMKHLPLLDEAKTADLVITVAFYAKTSTQTPVKIISFTSKGFNKLKPTLKDDHLIQLRNGGDAALAPLTTSIQIY